MVAEVTFARAPVLVERVIHAAGVEVSRSVMPTRRFETGNGYAADGCALLSNVKLALASSSRKLRCAAAADARSLAIANTSHLFVRA